MSLLKLKQQVSRLSQREWEQLQFYIAQLKRATPAEKFARKNREPKEASVFLVQHLHALPDGREDVKIIGIYSSRKEAALAVRRKKKEKGFRDSPKGFQIDGYPLDRDAWSEGFVTR